MSASPANTIDFWADTWTDEDIQDAKKLQGPIWVIGASGFIGAKLFFSLSRVRNDVFAVQPRVESNWRLLNCPYPNRVPLDITQASEVHAAVKGLRPKTVFNLSAYGAYERQNSVSRIHTVNYLGTVNLINELMETGCAAFVQAGSSSEYGLNCSGPLESDPLLPNSDYAVSKAAVSYLLGYYGKIRGFPSTHLRLYSIYGPWEERERLVPRLIEQGMEGKYPPLVNPEVSRDFVYIDDCTRAFVKAALTTCKDDPGSIYNIATGIKTSLGEIALLAKELFQLPHDPVFGSMPNRKWDLSQWYGNANLAAKKLEWKYRHSLADGLRLTADWEKVALPHFRFATVVPKREKLSAVVACYKDDQAIPIMHERLVKTFVKLGVDYEIIFVNDCSPNNDEQVIEEICRKDPHVLGISHSRNFGSQNAFLSGMEASTGDAVILMDGDLQDPPETIEAFYTEWKKGFTVVYGVRVKREAAWHMQVLYKLFYRLFQNLADIKIPLDAGDFSLLDRMAVEHLLKLPERDIFIRGLRAWIGFKQSGVPYFRPERAFGKSTNNFLKNIWWAKKAIFSFSSKPLHYIQILGFAIFSVSLLLGIFYTINYFINPPTNAKGVTTIVLLVLGIGGMQLLAVSVLGDYLGKVVEETKNRPRYIRSKIFKQNDVLVSRLEIEQMVKANREKLEIKNRA